MSFCIFALIWCGFWVLFFYGFGKVAENMMEGTFDIKGNAQEEWYDHVKEGGGMDLEYFKAWYEQKDDFNQMDKVEQIISELNVPLDMLEGDFEYHERWNGYPATGMGAYRRIDQVIDKLVEIGDIRAVEPLIKLAKKGVVFYDIDGYTESAVEALGNFNDKRSIDYLVKSLKDKDKGVRKAAADALDKLGWEPE